MPFIVLGRQPDANNAVTQFAGCSVRVIAELGVLKHQLGFFRVNELFNAGIRQAQVELLQQASHCTGRQLQLHLINEVSREQFKRRFVTSRNACRRSLLHKHAERRIGGKHCLLSADSLRRFVGRFSRLLGGQLGLEHCANLDVLCSRNRHQLVFDGQRIFSILRIDDSLCQAQHIVLGHHLEQHVGVVTQQRHRFFRRDRAGLQRLFQLTSIKQVHNKRGSVAVAGTRQNAKQRGRKGVVVGLEFRQVQRTVGQALGDNLPCVTAGN